MLFEVVLQSDPSGGTSPVSGATWNVDEFRWELDVATLEELLAIGVLTDSPVVVLAVGHAHGGPHVIEIRDREEMER